MDNILELVRRIEIIETALFDKSGNYWQSRTEQNGFIIGKEGSLSHVIDPLSGRPVTPGYHSITIDSSGRYTAETGSNEFEGAVSVRFKNKATTE